MPGTTHGLGASVLSKGRGKEVAEMLTGEMAKYRIDDRIREAASERAGRRLSARRTAVRRARMTRLVGVTAALLPFPFKH
jgi:hypothetical protein